MKGFTLVELLITVAIIAILAAIALPSYNDYVLRGQLAGAYSALADYRVRMEQFYQDNRRYDNGGGACGIAAPTAKHFTITCGGLGAAPSQTYQLDATGGGPTASFLFRIDQSNQRTTVSQPADWSAPSPNTCWVRRKDGTCV